MTITLTPQQPHQELKQQLLSGLSVQAEIRTGERKLIEFVLAPLFRHKAEALRER